MRWTVQAIKAYLIQYLNEGQLNITGMDDFGQRQQGAFGYMWFIVTAGWSIYPLGYFCGYLSGAVDETLLIVVYNVAGFVNKIGFVIHAGALQDAAERRSRRFRHGPVTQGQP